MINILKFLKVNSIEFKSNVDLSSFTYFKTGGFASIVILPRSISELISCVKKFTTYKIKFKIIGETSNLLFLDDTNYSYLIDIRKINKIKIINNLIVSECGALLPDLSRYALKNSVAGYEGLEGIPGTVGAAIYMNAGAYGTEIKDVLVKIKVLTNEGRIQIFKNKDLNLNYRSSIFKTEKKNYIILKGFFKIKKDKQISIYKKMSLFHNKRHKYQEWMYPNLGSIFAGSIYKELAKQNIYFGVVSFLYYFFFYKFRIFKRESPDDRKWLNDLAVRIFSIKYKTQPFSDKDLNTLTNRGQNTKEILQYINYIKKITNSKLELENEIVKKF